MIADVDIESMGGHIPRARRAQNDAALMTYAGHNMRRQVSVDEAVEWCCLNRVKFVVIRRSAATLAIL
jgi:hypothetical protein